MSRRTRQTHGSRTRVRPRRRNDLGLSLLVAAVVALGLLELGVLDLLPPPAHTSAPAASARPAALATGIGDGSGAANDGAGADPDGPDPAGPDPAAGTASDAPGHGAGPDDPGRAGGRAVGDEPAVESVADRPPHEPSERPGGFHAAEAVPDSSPWLALVGGLEVRAPVAQPDVIGFHQASTSRGLPLRPIGPVGHDHGPIRDAPEPEERDDAGAFEVLASRGRRAGPTTAVDVVAPHVDASVIAPVTGRVTDVRSYQLYGEHTDHRIEIRPTADPSLRVVLVHVEDVGVAVGDPVVAGTSVLAARPLLLPFVSQVDRVTGPDRLPHVHLEVQRFDAPRPGDPPPSDDADDEDADAEPS